MKSLTFHFNKNFIYVIIYWVLEISYHLATHLGETNFDLTNDEIKNEYFFVILLNIADLLSGFLVLYMKCSFKRANDAKKSLENKEQIANSKNELIYEKSDPELKKSFYKRIIIISILDYISRSSIWLSFAITGVKSNEISNTLQKDITITLDVIMRYVLSAFILKIVIYKHRIFALIMISLGFVSLIINDIVLMKMNKDKINDDEKSYNFGKTFYFTAIALISGLIFPIEDTFVKQIFSEDYLYPANMQFDRGVFEMVIILIMTPILYYSFNLELEFNSENVHIIVLILITFTIFGFVKAYILLKIIYHYSSQSVSFLIISQSFGRAISRIIKISRNKKYKNGYIPCIFEFIAVLFILFSSLVYDEIIIINLMGLNENVKKGIIKRGELEMEKIHLIDENELDNEPLNNDKESIENNNDDDDIIKD